MKIKYLIVVAMMASSCGAEQKGFDASGVFEAEETIVSAEASGRILSLNIEEGDEIPAGKTLGVIDTMQLHLQKLQLLKNAESIDFQRPDILKQLSSIETRIAQAETDRLRFEKLVAQDAANRKDLDDITTRINDLKAQKAALNSSLEKTGQSLSRQSEGVRIQVLQIDDKLSKCIISAPCGGTILAKYMREGEYAAPGKPIFKTADLSRMYLRAYFAYNQLANLKIGSTVKVFADDADGGYIEYQGVVTWISAQAEFTPKTVQTKDERQNLVYAVKILVNNDGKIKRGMYGQLKIRN